MEVEHPVGCGDSPAFYFHSALPRMPGSTLIGNQVIQVRQAGEKRRLTPTWMVEPFHHEQFPVDGVMGLIQYRAGAFPFFRSSCQQSKV